MNLFLSYFLLGISLAAPIGPVNAAQMERGLRHGFWNSWLLGVGSLLADVVLMLGVYFGIVHFIHIPIVKVFLWLFGAFVLFYSGVEGLIMIKEVNLSDNRRKESLLKSFFTGFMISISNPLSILFWLGIYGSIMAKAFHSYSETELFLSSFAVIFGLIVWDISMAAFSSNAKKIFNQKIISAISICSSIALIGFAIYFCIQATKILW